MQKIDFISYPFQRIYAYTEYIDYASFPMWIVPFTLLQPWPKEATSKLTAPIRPFTSEVIINDNTLCNWFLI